MKNTQHPTKVTDVFNMSASPFELAQSALAIFSENNIKIFGTGRKIFPRTKNYCCIITERNCEELTQVYEVHMTGTTCGSEITIHFECNSKKRIGKLITQVKTAHGISMSKHVYKKNYRFRQTKNFFADIFVSVT